MLGLNYGMMDSEFLWRVFMVLVRVGLLIKCIFKVVFMFFIVGLLLFVFLWELFFKGYKVFYNIYVYLFLGYEFKEYLFFVFFGCYVLS